MAIFTEHFLGERHDIYFPEDGDRCHPYNDKYWSKVEIAPLERIKDIQLARLKNIVRFAYEKSPFYRNLWKAHNIHPDHIRMLEDVQKLPIVTKEDIQRDQISNPPFGTLATTPPSNQPKFWRTSGTTATPRLFSSSWEDVENDAWQVMRSFYAQGVKPGWRGFFSFGFLPFQAFWVIFNSAEFMGCQVVPKGSLPTRPWLLLIKDLAPYGDNFMCCAPTFAFRQLEVLEEMGIDPKELRIKRIGFAGEPAYGIPSTHKYLKEKWGAEIHDIPGSTETSGCLYFSCEALEKNDPPSDHVVADRFLVELLDQETLQPAKGDTGVTCVTALGRFGFPIIRYLLKDLMTIKENYSCPCGRTLPVAIGGIKTRFEDMIIVKGVNLFPSAIEQIIRTIPRLGTEFRIKKTKAGDVEILVEIEKECSGNEKGDLQRIIQRKLYDAFFITFRINLLLPGTLTKEEGKTRRIIVEG